MIRSTAIAVLGATLTFAIAPAHAGGWGGSGGQGYGMQNYGKQSYNSFNTTKLQDNNYSSGFANVSPSLKIGDVNVGNGILGNSPILSGIGIGVLGTGSGLNSNLIGNVTKSNNNNKGRR